jgi:hypothetical protein
MDRSESETRKAMKRSNSDTKNSDTKNSGTNKARRSTQGGDSKIWKTKFGLRRVRHDPPTLEEAIIAASGLTDDVSEQVEIAASLMGAPADEVRAAMKASAMLQKHASTVVLAHGTRGARAVVVERKPSRRLINDRSPGR